MERTFPPPSEPYENPAEDTPVAKLWYGLLSDSIKTGLERIHITSPEGSEFGIRGFRDSSWHHIVQLPAPFYGAVLRRLKVMASFSLVRQLSEESGSFRFAMGSSVYRIEVTTRVMADGTEEAMIELPAPAISDRARST